MQPDAQSANAAAPPHPSFREALRFWLKLGFISFGGPTGQIAIMHTELVERRRWISEGSFLHALNYCMLLPGPEAQQLATYVGWLLHRTPGAIAAGALFVLPSAFILWLLSYVYAAYGKLPWIAAVFDGLKPVVTAIVAAAVIRIGRKVLRNGAMAVLAAAAFVAIFFLNAPFPVIVLSAGVIGLAGSRFRPRTFDVVKGHGDAGQNEPLKLPALHDSDRGAGRIVRVLLIGLALWIGPPLLIGRWLAPDTPCAALGWFFSKAAVVTFGGAYAVLPYVAQQAVERFGWLSAPQMLDGLGLAETTPGPLIMVVQFVGFLAGWHKPGSLSPLAAATLGAAVTTWVTFVPCFLWILLGAPYVERMRHVKTLNGALSAITASVVGVVLNLAVWFAMHVWRQPTGTVDAFAIALSLLAFVALVRLKWDVIPIVMVGAAAGLIRFVLRDRWNW